ncbi:uncharacterized protein LOC127843798 isoform X2 [Dreissena polymorpha]|uniref:uncharacterized protein LOC127843798 isoform X2 n=1 Tax=Dreissena polymorpha TaxID=45954 RepID=UPI002265389F|nr:uncharacterized protein LOC127843798 isoform X2 [Dreissena polymorpha]
MFMLTWLMFISFQQMAEGDIRRIEPGSENVPIYSSLYSRHSRNYVESVSVETCTIMNRLGYGDEIRRWRVEKFRQIDRLYNAELSYVTGITAGSKAEGLTGYLESDWDILFVVDDILCVEAGINIHTITGDMDVFRMDTRVYSGHCRLLQEREASTGNKLIHDALCDDGYGGALLSSSILLDEVGNIAGDGMQQHERAGPSIPGVIEGVLNMDTVYSLRCHCPSILQKWAVRPRHWPSTVIVQKVVSLGAYVTPVGHKGSENKHMEWRICFNTGETELVNNLNGTQVKVYVMLKMILKDILQPQKKEITSYVLKNIILWQAERNPQSQFNAHDFFYWLHDALRELRTAIAQKHVAYYMIPDRNLMAACGLEEALQHKWIADITDMMAEGPRVILRLPKIRQTIVASQEPMLWFSQKKMELEMLFLEGMTTGMESDQNYAISREVQRVSRQVQQRMLLEGSVVNNLDDITMNILMSY